MMLGPIGRRRLVGIPLTSLGTALVALVLTSGTVLGSVGWTTPVAAGPSYTWNYGHALARTVTDTTSYLHIQYTTDYVGGTFVDDDGPAYLGVYYRRGKADGSSWGTPRRLNPSDQHADRGGIAAAGSRVYAIWVSYPHIRSAYDPSDQRQLWFRANDSHGTSASWRDAVALTSSGRVDRPTVAATGSRVYVAYTDADTGNIQLAASPDHGVTWLPPVTVGTTDRRVGKEGADGYAGWPVVAATGSVVAVAWEHEDEPYFASSEDGGATFSPPESLGLGLASEIGIAARGDRVAVVWMTEPAARVRVRKAGVWGPERRFAGFDTTAYKFGYGPAVVLAGTSKLGIAWSACRRSSCLAGSTYGVDVRWRESSDNGAHWSSAVTVGSYSVSSSRRYNDYPSVLMTSTKRRVVLYNVASASYSKYKLLVEVGTGSP